MRNLAVRRLFGLAVGSLALLTTACSQEAPPAPPPPEVDVITIGTQPVPNVIELPGRVQAVRTAEVRARTSLPSS